MERTSQRLVVSEEGHVAALDEVLELQYRQVRGKQLAIVGGVGTLGLRQLPREKRDGDRVTIRVVRIMNQSRILIQILTRSTQI